VKVAQRTRVRLLAAVLAEGVATPSGCDGVLLDAIHSGHGAYATAVPAVRGRGMSISQYTPEGRNRSATVPPDS